LAEEELGPMAERLKAEIRRLEEAAEREGKDRSDLMAARRLLERSLFHIERARDGVTIGGPVEAEQGEMLDIEIEEDLLEANRRLAETNRDLLRKHGIRAIDVMGAIGSGKTSLIAAIVERLRKTVSVGMLGGDTATSIDADMVRRSGAQTVQINTGKECHLDANLVSRALANMDLDAIDVLFVENVGNLICPSEFDLGCDMRLVVISVTEGESMVVKHPMMFTDADVVAINKMDMAESFGSDPGKLERDLKKLNADAIPVRTSARTGQGLEELLAELDLV